MSLYSGKCDILDSMMVGHDDELEAFEDFKKQTDGTIYQMYHIKEVNEWNQYFIEKNCNAFKVIKNVSQDADKRFKEGFKEVTTYTYEYYGKTYTAKELKQKGGVYVKLPIHFETILDLVRYYPYTISMAGYSDGKAHIVISKESFVDRQRKDLVESGYSSSMFDTYNHELAEHYRELVRRLDYNLEGRTKEEEIQNLKECDSDLDYYHMSLNEIPSTNHPIQFVWIDGKAHSHWTSPKYCQSNIIKISKQDVDYYLKDDIKNHTVKVRYISAYKHSTNEKGE